MKFKLSALFNISIATEEYIKMRWVVPSNVDYDSVFAVYKRNENTKRYELQALDYMCSTYGIQLATMGETSYICALDKEFPSAVFKRLTTSDISKYSARQIVYDTETHKTKVFSRSFEMYKHYRVYNFWTKKYGE